jgi:hypothetical protein
MCFVFAVLRHSRFLSYNIEVKSSFSPQVIAAKIFFATLPSKDTFLQVPRPSKPAGPQIGIEGSLLVVVLEEWNDSGQR